MATGPGTGRSVPPWPAASWLALKGPGLVEAETVWRGAGARLCARLFMRIVSLNHWQQLLRQVACEHLFVRRGLRLGGEKQLGRSIPEPLPQEDVDARRDLRPLAKGP